MLTRRERTPLRKLMLLGAMAGAGALVEDTATGNPLTFITDVSKPLKSLLIPFTPIQSGTGDPSPQNIRSILPWNGLTVFGGGKNLLDIDELWDNGSDRGSGEVLRYCKIELPNGKYTVSTDVPNNTSNPAVASVFATNELVTPTSGYDGVFLSTPRTITVNGGELYIYIRKESAGGYYAWNKQSFTDYYIQLEAGQTATAYEPYKPITETDIPFASPVYGGEHEAVSGKLMDGWKAFDLGKLSWNVQNNGNNYYFVAILPSSVYLNMWTPGQIPEANNYPPHFVSDRFKTVAGSKIPTGNSGDNCVGMDWISAIRIRCDTYNHDASAFKTAMDGVMMYYELATPVEIQLTPAQITALVGDNTIWSDANGSMTAVYLKKG